MFDQISARVSLVTVSEGDKTLNAPQTSRNLDTITQDDFLFATGENYTNSHTEEASFLLECDYYDYIIIKN